MIDDPVRLLDEGDSELLRSLISAGREEEPQPAALRRTLIAVSVGAAVTGVAASASAIGSAGVSGTAGMAGTAALGTAKGASTALVVVKWLALGAIAGTIASSAAYGVSAALAPVPPVETAAPRIQDAPVVSQSPAHIAPASKELPEIPAPPAVAPPPIQILPEAAVSVPKTELGAPLVAEVAALDGARQALRAGDAARTLDLLGGYEMRFPEARMLPEALYLRLEAFTLEADKLSAEAVARRILLVYPSSPHAARARAVLGQGR